MQIYESCVLQFLCFYTGKFSKWGSIKICFLKQNKTKQGKIVLTTQKFACDNNFPKKQGQTMNPLFCP